MPKKFLPIVFAALLMGASWNANAQAFEKGGTYLSAHITGANPFNIYAGGAKAGYGAPYYSWYTPSVGGISAQMEWGIHQYVGLGFNVGLMGGFYGWGYYNSYYSRPFGMISIPIGIQANCHFYQIIADKTGKNLHADKLDVYAGLNAGSGISAVPTPGWINALFYVGPQAGVRYYFKPNIGVGGEIGWGKSFVSGGFTFKL